MSIQCKSCHKQFEPIRTVVQEDNPQTCNTCNKYHTLAKEIWNDMHYRLFYINYRSNQRTYNIVKQINDQLIALLKIR